MGKDRLDLIEQQLDERLDEWLAMKFAFISLAQALDESGALRLPDLARHLGMGAADIVRNDPPGDRSLAPVAALLGQLRDALLRTQ